MNKYYHALVDYYIVRYIIAGYVNVAIGTRNNRFGSSNSSDIKKGRRNDGHTTINAVDRYRFWALS